jgi:hypothetical protein
MDASISWGFLKSYILNAYAQFQYWETDQQAEPTGQGATEMEDQWGHHPADRQTQQHSATNQLGGALRASDTSLLRSWKLPAGFVPGQVYTVWLGYGLRENNSAGSLVFSAPGTRGRVKLMRRTPTGSWVSVPATWKPASGTLTFRPIHLQTLNGTFALVQG